MLGPIRYPDLPVTQVRAEIARAVLDHQVVVLAGETGSGKTTQLPKVLLELGRGRAGLIGHTQPRRIAARAVAERVAEELGVELGGLVGYAVRFHHQVSSDAMVKVMTDGVLLAELSRDRDLRAYDTIVIDEAHERSLTIDFLLGYLKRLLPRRPDLKVVITSATIDPDRFSRHFDGAPVLEVTGRTYPVEVRYRPLDQEDDLVTGIVRACQELEAEGPGDVLVFLSGEREIRDTADVLRGAVDAEVLPLYGRLSAAEQHRVFDAHRGRRIVLATNVAETSLTVPGIRYVVDPGTARISRYSQRTKVQRLPIEPISQASAKQRAGRCGRVAEGVCIRLYSEEDLASRPEFTEPEVLRTNLASVLLQMADLRLGDIEDFPFLDPPDRRQVRDGLALLEELGAMDGDRLTKAGRTLARLPVDPRLARMLVEADRLGCLREVLVIASALSIQDPRERPLDQRQQAHEAHARFVEPGSDLLAWLNLWRHLQEQQQALSSSAFRRMCRREHLSWLRIREWQDLHAQLRRSVQQLGMRPGASNPAHVTQALLAGLLSHVGVRQEGTRPVEYLGARGARFVIAPGSVLAKKPPYLVVAAELVETSRLYARGVAKVEPEQVEAVAGHLLRRSYSEPHWERRRGSVVAYERVTLYGVPIVAQRKVQYGRIDPVVSRELFLRHALVEGDWETHHEFWRRNRTLLADVEGLEHRARRRDIVVDDEAIYDFYDARVPDEVVSAAHFDAWWKGERLVRPDLLDLSLADLVRGEVDPGEHPDVWVSGDVRLPLSYTFEPGTAEDGVTVEVPVSVLNRVRAEDFAWQVPGLRHELVTALIKTLPKQLRVKLVPAPDTARQLLERLAPREEHLLEALSREARALRGVTVPVEEWGLDRLPAHLRPTFRVVDDRGSVLGEGKDLDALKVALAQPAQAAIASVAGDLERAGLTSWEVGDLPAEVSSGPVVGYPALVDEGASVALRVLSEPSPEVHHAGVRRLLLLGTPSPVKAVSGRLSNATKLMLAANPHGSLTALMDDAIAASVDALVPGDPRTAAEFEALLPVVRAGLPDQLLGVLTRVEEVLRLTGEVTAALAAQTHPASAAAVADVRAQVEGLVHAGFVTEVGAGRLADVARYLRAVLVRLDKLPREAARDASLMAAVHEVAAEWSRLPAGPRREQVRWMLEELRVSLFAPSVRAKGPVSVQRIYKVLDS